MSTIADWIEFGQVSAERDENLSNYFFENGVLQSVIGNRHNFLVLGRKGAGKTAVFQHLSENPAKYLRTEDLNVSLSLQDYNWNVHALLAAEGKAPSLAYIQSWKYIIYLLAVKELGNSGIRTDKIIAAEKLISKIYRSPIPTIGQLIGEKFLQLSRLKLPGGGFDLEGDALDSISIDGGEVQFSDVQSDKSLKDTLNKSIGRLSDIFEEALLDALSDTRRVIVSFDRIDEAWDTSSFESSQKIIAGLIGAAEYIVGRFKGTLRPIIFLREDIFETLDLNDKNKLRSDCGKLLAWTKDGLSRMILERVNFYARKSNKPVVARIEELFDRDQMRQQRSLFDYIMLRTMLRPGDFIKFFQLIKENMLERRDDPFAAEEINDSKLECESIYNAEPGYSEWLVEELRDEWRTQYPKINDLFSAIQNSAKTNLSADELFESMRKIKPETAYPDLNIYLRFLFDNSIVGFRVGNSQQWRYKCFNKTQGFLDSQLYKVHDGLHRGLNLKETRSAANPTDSSGADSTRQ